jgi:O-antigen/teichoic acid export membrane protein
MAGLLIKQLFSFRTDKERVNSLTRKKKLLYNTITSLTYQILTLVCGFILPRCFLTYYGSSVNGLVYSITQFMGFVSLAECGVGAVVQSALYKPLAEKDELLVSRIVVSSERFFRKIAVILCIYTAVLMAGYPFITLDSFDYLYTLGLILIISTSSFVQYYFSMSYRILLSADQLAFIQLGLQSVTILLNTVFSVALMRAGAGVHVVKLTTSLIFLIQPMALTLYVKKHYHLDERIELKGEPIEQKWNGLAQHIAAVVLGNTDIVVLTFFSTLENVSVYTVYHLVVNGVKQILTSLTSGMQSMLGNMYARKETETLNKTFSWIEWLLHFAVIFTFTCTAILILPFVKVYTADVTDANYFVPAFAFLISAAQALYCLRLPYNMMVLAAGHYKQTQWSAIIEAGINVAVSVALVKLFGLVGVVIGTLSAMLYRTTYLAWYLSKNILFRNFRCYLKHMAVDILCVTGAVLLTGWIEPALPTYFGWIMMAVKVAFVTLSLTFIFNTLFYLDYLKEVFRRISGVFIKFEKGVVRMIKTILNKLRGGGRT